ncbi:23S rRNA (guanosine-2'-O-)-methyltransferase RlmB [Stieleria maiorica]|uniref:23S rRNA (Guanosine-2'-O-)-methyltransferase RlmB n=1 Tax=Stieleria maiorica TaxID=2795974 RepID=A0A5B9MAM8_9BACT|nr:TrmH family RNA methyltransferase [Stieleria maiorica]QEF97120.1 23S rRNA (guanosine-2'-O-)-methyltransferase RlmB [Stieleria maiorica]
MLTSLRNPTVKRLVKMRDNRARRKTGHILVDGWRETQRAIQAGLDPLGIYAVADSGDATAAEDTGDTGRSIGPQSDARRFVIDAAGQSLVDVSAAVMQKIAYGQSERGVVAEFAAPPWGLSELRVPESGLILVLDQIEKPGNIGAAFRCADAAGADAVILCPAAADRFNPNAIRNSLGAVFSVPSAAADEADARSWLVRHGYGICAARVESSRPLWQADLTGPVAIVIGSEAFGLGAHWQSDPQTAIDAIRIPMAGDVDSLNASVSAAVFLYEAARQREATVG